MSAPTIDPASAAAVVTAANRCREVLTARIDADLRILADAARAIAADYERRTA